MDMKNNRNSNKKKGAFLLRPVQVQKGRKNRLTAFLTDVCFVWIYLAGMSLWLDSSLQLNLSVGICLLTVLGAALLQQLAAGGWSEKKSSRRWLGKRLPRRKILARQAYNQVGICKNDVGGP